MKSYTDIEQSEKLLSIGLNPSTADMEYIFLKENNHPIGNVPFVKDDSEVEDSAFDYLYNRTPCWSLAALLAIIPEEVEIDGKHYAPCSFPVRNGMWIYKLWYNSNKTITSPISIFENNLVDACVAMIEKLNELNLL